MSPTAIVVILLVNIVAVMSLNMTPFGDRCGDSFSTCSARIPDAMPLSVFDSKIANRFISQIYFGRTPSEGFIPLINTISKHFRVSATSYNLTVYGDRWNNSTSSYECGVFTFLLNHQIDDNTATFTSTFGSSTFLLRYFTNCADKYVFSFTCLNWNRTSRKCPRGNFRVTLDHVNRERPNDMPLGTITKELNQRTKLEMGFKDLKWYFTFGEQKLCGV